VDTLGLRAGAEDERLTRANGTLGLEIERGDAVHCNVAGEVDYKRRSWKEWYSSLLLDRGGAEVVKDISLVVLCWSQQRLTGRCAVLVESDKFRVRAV
jgi:hypothetical protein